MSRRYWRQPHRSEYRESASHIVGNDVGLVSVAVCQGAEGTLPGICHSHYQLFGCLHAYLALKLLFEQTERDGRLGGGAALADYDNSEFPVGQELLKLIQVVLADILAGKQHLGPFALGFISRKAVLKGLNHGLGAQIGAAYTYADHIVHCLTELVGCSLDVIYLRTVYLRRKIHPPVEIVAGTFVFIQVRYTLQRSRTY